MSGVYLRHLSVVVMLRLICVCTCRAASATSFCLAVVRPNEKIIILEM